MILTIAAIKGGTGKTTTAAALAQAAAVAGAKVLAVDLDPQANLTLMLGADQNAPGAVELLDGTATAAQVIQATQQGVHAITAAPDLAAVQTYPGSARRIADALKAVSGDYDIIVIDTPPTMGELTFNALQAAEQLLIPLEADASSLQGLYQVADIAHQIAGKSNPALHIAGCVLTRYDRRPKINRYMRDTIAATGEELGAPLIAEIRSSVAVREAQALQQSLYEYAPSSGAAEDYAALFAALNAVNK